MPRLSPLRILFTKGRGVTAWVDRKLLGTPVDDEHRSARLRLRFRDPALESAYRADRYRHDLGNIRFGFLAGIAIWVAWGLLLRPYMLALSDQRLDVIMRTAPKLPLSMSRRV